MYFISISLSWCGSCSLHVLTSTHNFINKQQLLGEDWGDVHELTLDDVVVPNLFNGGWEWFTSLRVDTISSFVFYVGLLYFEKGILSVKT